MLASILVAASAGIVLALGLLHLIFTFHGTHLHPRDSALQARMQEVSPGITRQTTMWRTWVGFNASHSIALILFGWIYGYLALAHGAFLFASTFLLATGLVVLAAYCVLARLYFFSTPFRGVVLATMLYGAGVAVALAAN